MKTTSVVLIILMCVVSMLFAGAVDSPNNKDINKLNSDNWGEKPGQFRVISQTSSQIKLHVSTPELEVRSSGNIGFYSLDMLGSAPTAEAGLPELPVYSAWIAIPARGDFSIEVNHGTVETKGNIVPKPVFATEQQERDFSYNSEAYAANVPYPASRYAHSAAQVIRDFRVVQVNLYPVQYHGANQEVSIANDFDISITMNDNAGENELPAYTGYSAAFAKLYESMICNFANYRDVLLAQQNARILLIYGNNSDTTFQAKLAEFVAWKRQKGYEVDAVSTNQTGGSSNTAIKNYIQTQYNNTSTRPDYIILLGDTSGSYTIPTYYETLSGYNGEGDYPYTHLAGADLLGDVFIGRISAENVSQIDVLFNKIYAVEKNINVSGTNASWLNRVLLIGDPSSSGISTQYVNKFIKEMALRTNPEYTFIENYSSGFSSTMNSGINQGVGFFNYRGYIGMSGWEPSSSLVNGTKLPHATILTCGTGNFGGGTGTTESLMRLGTAASPKGSVTAIGMATSGTHTLFNNCLNAGIYDGIFTSGMRTMGEALLNGRLYIKQVYGATHDNQANYFSHWCNLMGDPTVEVFTGVPEEFTVLAPSTLPVGTNIVDVNVLDPFGLPVINACVTAFGNVQQAVISKVWTDEEGNATLTLGSGFSNDIILTVSKHEFKPFQQNITVDTAGSVVFVSKTLYDNGQMGSSGNSDGYAEATETIAVNVELKNTTANLVGAATAVLTTEDEFVTLINSSSTIGAIASGANQTTVTAFTFSLGANLPPQHDARFNILITDTNNNTYNVIFHVLTYNARLMVQNHSITGGGNSILDPAEEGFLQVGIKNNSISWIDNIYAELHSLNDLVVVNDSVSYVGSIPAGSTSTTIDGFEVFARALLIPGMQMPMRLRLYNAAGFEQYAEFNIPIGQVSVNTPLGPDAYGYFIYDMSDVNYSDCPTYQWVDIHPSEGGSGTQITGFNDSGDSNDEGDQNGSTVLQSVNLPFAFPFYGVSYNQITVCVNGFITMGPTANGEFRNYHLPGGYGPSPMIAPFWDDLILIGDAGIYKYSDTANHTFTIQYHKMRNGYNRTSLETFQVIFYDPLYYPTSLGDGMIKIQYKDFNNVDIGGGGYTPRHGNYSTIGIKDHTNTRGLEYSFNNQYPLAAAPLASQKALLITTAPVLHESAFLVLDEVIISDANNNGIAEPGETIELGVKLMNLGINTAQSIQLTASTTSDFATLVTNSSLYGNIPGDASGVNNSPLTLQIDIDCADGVVIPIVCNVTIAGNSWQYPISVVVQKPAIQVSGLYMNDVSGNGNGLVDPGETLKLIVNYTNNSALDAKNITSNIMCLSEFVNIPNPSQLLPGVPSGGTSQAVYDIVVSPDVIVGNNITFYLTYLGDLIDPHNEQVVLSVGTTGMNEDFETDNGDFVSNPTNNAWEWGVSTQAGAHSGTKVWGTRLNNPYPANVTYTLTTPAVFIGTNFMLEFWHKFNTEATYDGGNVKISTNNGNSWTLITPEGGYTSDYLNILEGPGYDGDSGGWIPARFNLATYSNQSVRFRFTFASDGLYEDFGWFIDDVRTTGFVEFAGEVSGTVASSNPDIDFSTVSVHNTLNWSAHPDETGAYALYLPVGTHQVGATAEGYSSNPPVGLTLSLTNPTSQQDYYLGHYSPATALGYGVTDGVLTLFWTAPVESEFTSTGYDVYRKVNAGAFEQVAHVYDPIYTETLGEISTHYYFYVVATYSTGNSLPTEHLSYIYTSDNEDDNNPVLETKLINNYPNPFNPETIIKFSLKEATNTTLSVYNLKGQLVKNLVAGTLPEGMHQAIWNGKDSNNRNVASGMYFYRLESGNYHSVKKMLLMK